MASLPQIGDLVRLCELGYLVWDLGWSEANNASRQYHEFGNEVRQLHAGLVALTKVFENTTTSLAVRGLDPPADVSFAWDRTSFLEIVGDFEETLTECVRLLENNRSYSSTTGPVENITWNVFVQPSVNRLQRRLQFHNTKLALVLKPFEFDIRVRIHKDLQNRLKEIHGDIQGVWDDVKAMRQELQALRESIDPSLVTQDEERPGHEHYTLGIPFAVEEELTRMYERHPTATHYSPPSLPELADAFVRVFNMSTRRLQPKGGGIMPSQEEYLALMASQFLMDKILSSNEVKELSAAQHSYSHWKTYINFLRRALLEESRRFMTRMDRPVITDPSLVPEMWPSHDPPTDNVDSVRLPVMMEYLLEVPLLGATPDSWRKLKLLRYCDGTDRKFRLVLTGGKFTQPQSEARTIDFDLARSILVPLYASPDYHDGPLEMILRANNEMHSLKFGARVDLYNFQQALTGYEVVDQHMEYNLKIIFVSSSGSKDMEKATMQLWRPCRVEGEVVMADPDAQQPFDHAGNRRASGVSVETSTASTSSHSSSRSRQGTANLRNENTGNHMQDLRGPAAIEFLEPGFNPWSPSNDVGQDSLRQGTHPHQNGLARHAASDVNGYYSMPYRSGRVGGMTGENPPRIEDNIRGRNRAATDAELEFWDTRQSIQQPKPWTYPNGYNSSGDASILSIQTDFSRVQIGTRSANAQRNTQASSATDSSSHHPPRHYPFGNHDPFNIGPYMDHSPGAEAYNVKPPTQQRIVGPVVDSPVAYTNTEYQAQVSEPPRGFEFSASPYQLPAKIAPDIKVSSRRIAELRGGYDIDERRRGYMMKEVGQLRGSIRRPSTQIGTGTLQSFGTRSVFTARDVTIAGSMNLKGTGTLHCMPTDPLMVLFTKTAKGHPAVVSLPVDDKIVANYSVCHCLTGGGEDGSGCRITAMERSGNTRPLNLLRLGEGGSIDVGSGGQSQWDILPLAETRRGERSARQRKSTKRWCTMIRISILHESKVDRFHFSGMPCGCGPCLKEGDLMRCLAAGHRGLLGLLKEWYRREVVEWTNNRYQLTGNVIQT